jgi:hypothetical protein
MINCQSKCKLAGFILFPLVFLANGSGEMPTFQLSGVQSVAIFMAMLLVVWLLIIWQSAASSREQRNSHHDESADQHNPAENLS